jgi:hypothetical protein
VPLLAPLALPAAASAPETGAPAPPRPEADSEPDQSAGGLLGAVSAGAGAAAGFAGAALLFLVALTGAPALLRRLAVASSLAPPILSMPSLERPG